ncbi:MAG: hypothetical protein V3V13_11705 [Paracoccaceae bacterium]
MLAVLLVIFGYYGYQPDFETTPLYSDKGRGQAITVVITYLRDNIGRHATGGVLVLTGVLSGLHTLRKLSSKA